MNWGHVFRVVGKGLIVTWKATRAVSNSGLPLPGHVGTAIRVATAIEDAARKQRNIEAISTARTTK